jgi:hypothetical protein
LHPVEYRFAASDGLVFAAGRAMQPHGL